MSGISKRVSGSWVSGDYGIMKTATDTITTLPADIYANAATATVGLKGQTVQSSIPSPTSPVMPQGTGERTGNLFDISTVEKGRIDNGVVGYASATTDLSITGNNIEFTTNANFRGVCGGFIEIPNGTESISFYGTFKGGNGIGKKFVFYDAQKTWLNKDSTIGITDNGGTATIPNGAKFVRMSFTSQASGTASISNFMLNIGPTALPFEPYGYKLDIKSANTTTPVYLGEVQTTRKIKKLVLDGTENITQHSVQNDIIGVRIPTPSSVLGSSIVICSHYEGVLWPVYNGYRRYGIVASNPSSGNAIVYMSAPDSEHNTLSTFVQWIKDQYAAGTPVTVWYVLATPTTGIVNEPLQKIGNYADEVSNISIPVTAGGDTLSVDTIVQPSVITVNYKGWHPKTPKESNNGQWS